jgi:ABC-type microcin C transport system duplicated ATPase subunit YejF
VSAAGDETPATGNGHETLVTIEDLGIHFPITSDIVFRPKVGAVHAVDGIDLAIRRGETLGLLGHELQDAFDQRQRCR